MSLLIAYKPAVSSGLIGLWHGTIVNIPAGWLICDGNNGTPNLLAKFVEGVATAATNPGTTGGATAKTTAGHFHSGPSHVHSTPAHTLSVAEIPVHSHTAAKWGDVGVEASVCTGGGVGAPKDVGIQNTGGGGSHSHGNTGAGGTGNTGSKTDSIADIRPLFYDIAFIMKT